MTTAALALTTSAADNPTRIARVEIGDVTWRPPDGADGLPRVDLTWLDDGGARHPLGGGGTPYVYGIAFQGAALVVDAEGTLWRIDASEERVRVGVRVVDGPVASPDGRLVGWFSGRLGEPTELWTWDGAATRRLVRGLAGSAGLRFDPKGESIAFVSARNGGIAGLWVTSTKPGDARCLTNCDLRVGQDWRAGYRALPDLATLEFSDGALRFVDLDGRAQEVAR